MKLLVIISVAGILLLQACYSNYLTKEESEKVFEHKVDLSKEEIRNRLILYANEEFVSSKAVIQTDEDGLLAGNGVVPLDVFLIGLRMKFTFIVKYTDDSYKVKWIVKDIFTNNGSALPGVWGEYAGEIDEAIKKSDEDRFAYLSDNSSDF